ncbi:MAG: hypothetical protein M1831_004622 [Alyxoria varia]|nr:MAG: hypothetical protein M1831_004622 [Alyxoria varia]
MALSIDIPTLPGAFPSSPPLPPTYDSDQPTRLTNLPVELLLNILGYADHSTLKSTLAVNRQINTVIHEHFRIIRDLIIDREYHSVRILAPRPRECSAWYDTDETRNGPSADESESAQCEDIDCILLMGACLRTYFPPEYMRRRYEDQDDNIRKDALIKWEDALINDWRWLALLDEVDRNLQKTLDSWKGMQVPVEYNNLGWLARRTRRELLSMHGLNLMCNANTYEGSRVLGVRHGMDSLKRANKEATVRGNGGGQRVGIGV